MGRISRTIRWYADAVKAHGVRTAITWALVRWRPVTVRIHGEKIKLRHDTPDFGVASESLGGEFDALKGILPADFCGLIIDAGGYIGTSAIAFSRLYPRATIAVVEPSDENFEILAENVAAFPNIKPIRAALAPGGGEKVRLSNPGKGQWGYTIVERPLNNPDAAALQDVATVSISDIRAMFPGLELGIVKLDIEGGEVAVFDGSAAELAEAKAVFAELHDFIAPGAQAAFDRFSADRIVSQPGGEKFLSLRR